MGSKAKITKYIVPIIQRKIDESGARYYVEPFAGGCNVIDKIKAEYRIASDSNKYLIALFQHLQDGGELPEHITREEYNKAREAYRTGDNSLQAWYIGAAGFLASYNGRFYDGGYAGYGKDKGRVRDYYRESRNNILMQMQQGGIFGIIKGRVNFEIDGQKSKDPAPFPSMIVVFNGKQPTSAVKSITA